MKDAYLNLAFNGEVEKFCPTMQLRITSLRTRRAVSTTAKLISEDSYWLVSGENGWGQALGSRYSFERFESCDEGYFVLK